MAVRVRATDIEDGTLPGVCVVTGQPGTANWNVRYVNPAGALWLLLVFGVLPFVIARFLTRHVVEGRLPISQDGIAIVRRHRRAALSGGLIALGIGVGGVMLGVSLESWQVAVAAVATAFVMWCVISFLHSEPVGGDVEQNGRYVRLTRTHPGFADAVASRLVPV